MKNKSTFFISIHVIQNIHTKCTSSVVLHFFGNILSSIFTKFMGLYTSVLFSPSFLSPVKSFLQTFKHMPKNFVVVTLPPGLFLAMPLVHESNPTHRRPKSSILVIRLRPCMFRRQLVHLKTSILGARATYDSSSKKYIICSRVEAIWQVESKVWSGWHELNLWILVFGYPARDGKIIHSIDLSWYWY